MFDFDGDFDMLFLWVICDLVRLMGIKYGCGIGVCGVCIVYFDGEVVCVCVLLVVSVVGCVIMMIEGLLYDCLYLV